MAPGGPCAKDTGGFTHDSENREMVSPVRFPLLHGLSVMNRSEQGFMKNVHLLEKQNVRELGI